MHHAFHVVNLQLLRCALVTVYTLALKHMWIRDTHRYTAWSHLLSKYSIL